MRLVKYVPQHCRGVGLAVYECLSGTYPYDAKGGPLQLMISVGKARLPPSAKAKLRTWVA